MPLRFPAKDPNEVLDYQINWTARLEGDTITGSTWIVPEGVTKDSDSFSDTATVIWLSGGAVTGTDMTLVNRVTTSGGRTYDQGVNLKIEEK